MLASISRAILGLVLLATIALSASLTQVPSFGSNPTGVQMFIYVPDKLAAKPAIIVAIHYCTGTAQAYYSGTQYARLADTYGFIVIYPDAPDPGGCWDVHTSATLTHDAGGDSLAIASMVRYTLAKYSADPARVFMTGTSSGAMMTNVLAGAYPDLFAAGAAFAGVPYGCFAGPDLWNSQCASGQLVKTAKAWGDQARGGYPGYMGKRPRLQLWHGVLDTTLYYENLVEANKQWPNVLNLAFTRNNTNTPIAGYTQMIYGDGTQYVAYSAAGVDHNIPVRENDVLAFFGITGGSSGGGGGGGAATTTAATTLRTSTTTAAPAPTGSSGGTVTKWGQCGGQGYTGATVCAAGSSCTVVNAYYSQCL